MNEVQGPTPAGTSRPYRNLADALRAHRMPDANVSFIVSLTDAIGITTYIDRGRYIEALRRGDGAALHIGRTYTNGFTEDEQILIGGRALPLLPSEGRAPYFYVNHPSVLPPPPNTARRAAGARRAPAAPRAASATRTPKATPTNERDYGVCEVCFMVKNASGKCGCDD